jgi:protein-S-isoprenylcysteine O-methyltransferase Ste14
MRRWVLVIGYGAVVYALFLAVLVYTIGFLSNVAVPRGIDEGSVGSVWVSVLIDAVLLGLFAVQHTVMARPAFKRWWTRFIPEEIERSTFVLAATLLLALVVSAWQPLPATVWSVDGEVTRLLLHVVYVAGWITVVGSTFLIDHFDLFGLRQVAAYARERSHEPTGFRQPFVYRLVRHPIMVGFIIAFWATPDMSAGRLLFAALGTGYILIGVRFEERDLRSQFGEAYGAYQARVPRFLPRPSLQAVRRAVNRHA